MLKTIATYSFPYEAQIARARLDSEGIPAFVADEQTINMQWLYSNALGIPCFPGVGFSAVPGKEYVQMQGMRSH